MLRLYDTATGEVRELALRQPGQVDIYLCGPTVYGPPHLGHGRATLAYDVLRRYLEWSGLRVRLVSNITDIDDKIISRANREGRDAADIATRCEAVWFRAMRGIGVDPPTDIPRATEYVDEMVAMIGQLIERGCAYATDDGVYLDVAAVEDYGLLAHQSLDQMLSGGGERTVHGADQKHAPADFALWKTAKPGEPSWPSPWGDGRPGWHTECVVMALDLLGEGFDLHAGGLDLKFPHHENERAQAVALGRRFANHWMHHAFVVDESGEKMSKSLDNYENLLDLIDQVDGRAFRMVLLQAHYRSPVQVGPERIESATRALGRIDALARRDPDLPHGEPDAATLAAFTARMEDDLDTPGAMAVVFDAVSRAQLAPRRRRPRRRRADRGRRLVDVRRRGPGAESGGRRARGHRPPGRGARRRPGGTRLRHGRHAAWRAAEPRDGWWRPRRTGRRCIVGGRRRIRRVRSPDGLARPPASPSRLTAVPARPPTPLPARVLGHLDDGRARPGRLRHHRADPAPLRRALRGQRHPGRAARGLVLCGPVRVLAPARTAFRSGRAQTGPAPVAVRDRHRELRHRRRRCRSGCCSPAGSSTGCPGPAWPWPRARSPTSPRRPTALVFSAC